MIELRGDISLFGVLVWAGLDVRVEYCKARKWG